MTSDAEGWAELLLIGISFVLTAFASAAEASITSANPFRVRRMANEGVARAGLLVSILESKERHLAALLILKNAALIVAACLTTILGFRYTPHWGTVIAILSLTLLVLFLGRLIPRAWATRAPISAALLLARPVLWLTLAFAPFIRLLKGVTDRLVRPENGQDAPKDAAALEAELQLYMDAGEEEGYIEQDEREMIASICEFDATLVREIMVPRIDMVAIELNSSIDEALDVILQTGYSRIPVYDETIENVVGILNAKDLLVHLRDDGASSLKLSQTLRPAHFVPETNTVGELLEELKRDRIHMAIVVDEYGGIAGLATIEDALEEIVGEIEDEYDTSEPFCEMVSDDEAIFNARMDLDDVNKIMNIDLPTEDSDTLGGLIYSLLGAVPRVGDEVMVDGVKISVLSLLGRRIKKVRVTKEK